MEASLAPSRPVRSASPAIVPFPETIAAGREQYEIE